MPRPRAVDPGVKEVAAYGTAAVSAAAVAYGCVVAKRKRDSVAVVDLYNQLVELPEPTDLTQEDVAVRAVSLCDATAKQATGSHADTPDQEYRA